MSKTHVFKLAFHENLLIIEEKEYIIIESALMEIRNW